MAKLGSWTTIDCPTEKENEALAFLQAEFEKIDGKVYKKMNQHDLGEYISFEIDYPYDIKEIDEDDDDKMIKKDEWHDKANEIEEKYNKKFSEWL